MLSKSWHNHLNPTHEKLKRKKNVYRLKLLVGSKKVVWLFREANLLHFMVFSSNYQSQLHLIFNKLLKFWVKMVNVSFSFVFMLVIKNLTRRLVGCMFSQRLSGGTWKTFSCHCVCAEACCWEAHGRVRSTVVCTSLTLAHWHTGILQGC